MLLFLQCITFLALTLKCDSTCVPQFDLQGVTHSCPPLSLLKTHLSDCQTNSSTYTNSYNYKLVIYYNKSHPKLV